MQNNYKSDARPSVTESTESTKHRPLHIVSTEQDTAKETRSLCRYSAQDDTHYRSEDALAGHVDRSNFVRSRSKLPRRRSNSAWFCCQITPRIDYGFVAASRRAHYGVNSRFSAAGKNMAKPRAEHIAMWTIAIASNSPTPVLRPSRLGQPWRKNRENCLSSSHVLTPNMGVPAVMGLIRSLRTDLDNPPGSLMSRSAWQRWSFSFSRRRNPLRHALL